MFLTCDRGKGLSKMTSMIISRETAWRWCHYSRWVDYGRSNTNENFPMTGVVQEAIKKKFGHTGLELRNVSQNENYKSCHLFMK